MKWINVKDELPKTKDLRILFAVTDINDQWFSDVVSWSALGNCFLDGRHKEYTYKVTHYCELPKL